MSKYSGPELNFEQGAELRDRGIKRAVDHAERVVENWADIAYKFLKRFAADGREFMAEDVRIAGDGVVPEPPSKRAWGGVIVKAKVDGFIKHVGYSQVKNKKAHCTPASVWKRA